MNPCIFPVCFALAILLPRSGAGAISSETGDPAFGRAYSAPFMPNVGQIANSRVRFHAPAGWGSVFLTEENEGSIDYVLPERDGTDGWMLRERFLGARPLAYAGAQPAETLVHFFRGSRPDDWKSGVETWNTVGAGEIYPGIELSLRVNGSSVEKWFVVRPGGDPASIRARIEGAEGLRLEQGELCAGTGRGDVRFSAPRAFQEQTEGRRPVEVAYRLSADGYGFSVGAYDPAKPLVIDPLLASTFIGGGNLEEIHACAVATNGNVYVAGQTMSTTYPTQAGCYRTTYVGGSSDAFVSCLNSNLTTLLFSTFLGGTNGNEQVDSILLGAAGEVVVAGSTMSTNFPTTAGAYDRTFNGPDLGSLDLFVAKLDANLSTLQASTFLGGTFNESDAALAFSPQGRIYVAAQSVSTNYPVSAGAYMTAQNGMGDAVVTLFDAGLSNVVASTYLGGDEPDRGNDISVDALGNVYVTGPTSSTNFPTTPTAFSRTRSGTDDAFVAKLSSNLTAMLECTYLGGTSGETGERLALDRATNVLVAGYTSSSNFPTRAGGFDTNYNGSTDVFVAKLAGNLRSLVAGTYLGGNDSDTARGMTIDGDGHVWIVGVTSSTNFPVTGAGYDRTYNGGSDMFVARVHGSLSNLLAATYLGGADADSPWGIALDRRTNAYVCGGTSSSGYPTTAGAYDRTYAGERDAFATLMNQNLGAAAPVIVQYEVVPPDCHVYFLSETGYTYRLQYSDHLTSWTDYSITNGTGGTNLLIDHLGAGPALFTNFNRVVVE